MDAAAKNPTTSAIEATIAAGGDAKAAISIGVIGLGTIATAFVRGLLQSRRSAQFHFVVSRRSERNSQALLEAYPDQVRVCDDNQDVVDACEVLVLAVRTPDAKTVLSPLKAHAEQLLLTFMATIPSPDLADWMKADVSRVVRAVPLPPIAYQRGATIYAPRHPLVHELFDLVGVAIPVSNPEQLRGLQAITSLMGPAYAQMLAAQRWCEAHGVPSEAAVTFVSEFYSSICDDARLRQRQMRAEGEDISHLFQELVNEQTPGGLNERAIGDMTALGAYDSLARALDNTNLLLQGVVVDAEGNGAA